MGWRVIGLTETVLASRLAHPPPWTASVVPSIFWVLWMFWIVVACLCVINRTSPRRLDGNSSLHDRRDVNPLSLNLQLGYSGNLQCLLKLRHLALHVDEHVDRNSRNCSCGISTVFRTVCTARWKEGDSTARLDCPSLCR